MRPPERGPLSVQMRPIRAYRAALLALAAALVIGWLNLVLLVGFVRAVPPPFAAATLVPACVGDLLGQLRIAEAWWWTLCHDQGASCEWQLARQRAVLMFQLAGDCAI